MFLVRIHGLIFAL